MQCKGVSVQVHNNIVHCELQWVLLATVRDGDYKRVSSILQESCADLDINCQDHVRIYQAPQCLTHTAAVEVVKYTKLH